LQLTKTKGAQKGTDETSYHHCKTIQNVATFGAFDF